MAEISNEQLLVMYKNAEIQAFEILYKRHKSLIFNFLRMKLGNSPDAEEAFQETFYRIHKYILKYDPNQSAMNWIFTIAKNAAIDIIKKNHKMKAVGYVNPQEFIDSSFSTHFSMEAKQTFQELLKSLSPEECSLLKARFFDCHSYEDIASQLKLKPEGVRKRVSRLVGKLKSNLDH